DAGADGYQGEGVEAARGAEPVLAVGERGDVVAGDARYVHGLAQVGVERDAAPAEERGVVAGPGPGAAGSGWHGAAAEGDAGGGGRRCRPGEAVLHAPDQRAHRPG